MAGIFRMSPDPNQQVLAQGVGQMGQVVGTAFSKKTLKSMFTDAIDAGADIETAMSRIMPFDEEFAGKLSDIELKREGDETLRGYIRSHPTLAAKLGPDIDKLDAGTAVTLMQYEEKMEAEKAKTKQAQENQDAIHALNYDRLELAQKTEKRIETAQTAIQGLNDRKLVEETRHNKAMEIYNARRNKIADAAKTGTPADKKRWKLFDKYFQLYTDYTRKLAGQDIMTEALAPAALEAAKKVEAKMNSVARQYAESGYSVEDLGLFKDAITPEETDDTIPEGNISEEEMSQYFKVLPPKDGGIYDNREHGFGVRYNAETSSWEVVE